MSRGDEGIIEEFRANHGRVGGYFEGAPLLLLHHIGARTGTKRVSPLMYQPVDGGHAVFASRGGASRNPGWYHNLKAHPETRIELGDEIIPVRAREAGGAEYERIWGRQKSEWPQFATYERKTSRARIPVIVLETL